jgi:hypothetical protein
VKAVCLLLVVVLISGCAGLKRTVSRTDPYDSVKIDEMVGNNLSSALFQRTILCLNARRETLRIDWVTNEAVVLLTNTTLAMITNLTVTMVTNESRTLATNQVALPPPPPSTAETNGAAPPETNQVLIASATPNSTNVTVTTGANLTSSRAGNQIVTTANFQRQLSRQITVSSNNVSVTTADNQAASVETNMAVTTVTNQLVTPITNLAVVETNLLLRDYFLYTELTPPPDFVLQQGESLVLLVDGVRYGFAPGNSHTVFISRGGYTSTLYRVPPEVLVAIANAKQVRVRVKGVSSVIERKMTRGSRESFKKFLLKYFGAEPGAAQAASRGGADRASSQTGS